MTHRYPSEPKEALAISLAVFGMVQVAIFLGVGFSVGVSVGRATLSACLIAAVP